jgi:EmrB/QacA subfamily drug resistance transporter
MNDAVDIAADAGLSPDEEAGLPPATPAEIRRCIFGLMLVLALASLDGNIVGPALPRIVSDLGGLSHLSWVVTAFAVASTASTPLYGKLSDQFGRRPAFFVSIGLFLLGSVFCGAAGSMPALIISRAVQGVGAGGLMTLSQTTIADLVSPRERGRYQGAIAGVFALCSVAGPLAGGLITDMLSWPWIFYINLPIGAAALAILSVSLRPHVGRPSRGVDWLGFGLLIGATCTWLLLLSWGGVVYPWLSAPVLGLAALTVVMVGVLVPVEHRAAEPAVPPHLFHDRVFTVGVAVVTLSTAALFGALVFIPLFFQVVLGASATEAGLRMAPMMGGLIISAVLGGRMVTKTGRYKLYPVVGLAAASVVFVAMAWAARAGASANAFDGLLVALGLGIGLIMPNMTTAVQNAVAPSDIGIATATLGFFRSLGGALGVAVSGAILAATLHARIPAGQGGVVNAGLTELRDLPAALRAEVLGAYGHALSATFATAAVVSLLAFALVVFLPDRKLRDAPHR